jgi:hypothetical protein
MFFTLTKTAIISLILIILIHYSYIFLKSNLTTPKVKDLVDKPDATYKEIYNTICKKKHFEKKKNNNLMKDELKKYLLSLSKEKKEKKIEPIGGMLGNDQFNNYQTFN